MQWDKEWREQQQRAQLQPSKRQLAAPDQQKGEMSTAPREKKSKH